MNKLKKMDEDEQLISIKSIKIAYGFTVICLFIWFISDFINNDISSVALLLLISQNLVLIFSHKYLKKNKMNLI